MTFLTLVLVPVMYSLTDDMGQRCSPCRPSLLRGGRLLGGGDALAKMGIAKVRHLSSTLVMQALQRERLTLDFDGSVISTCGHAEGSRGGLGRSYGNYNESGSRKCT